MTQREGMKIIPHNTTESNFNNVHKRREKNAKKKKKV